LGTTGRAEDRAGPGATEVRHLAAPPLQDGPVMGSRPRAALRYLVVAVVLATAGFGLPARALTGDGPSKARVAVLALTPGPAGAVAVEEAVATCAGHDPTPRPSGRGPVAHGVGPWAMAQAGPPEAAVIRRREWGAIEGMRDSHPEFAPISKLIGHHTVPA